MPPHPRATSLLGLNERVGDPPVELSTPEAAREARRSRQRPATEVVHEIRDPDAGGVAARLYRPRPDEGLRLLVFLHGGGWVIDAGDARVSPLFGTDDSTGSADPVSARTVA